MRAPATLCLALWLASCRAPSPSAPPPRPSPPEPLRAAAPPAPTPEPPPPRERSAEPLLTFDPAPDAASLAPLSHNLLIEGKKAERSPNPQIFPERYAEVDGVLTFRGNPSRTGGAFGTARLQKRELAIAWQVKTGPGREPWAGGAAWTGQPALVRWPAVVLHSMPVRVPEESLADFVEVLQGSLDGRVHFLDLKTGARTRPPLDTGNPIKGSVSVDPRGYPLLFVGQGIPDRRPIGLRAYSLITGRELFLLPGIDPLAPIRSWGAFDSSGLLNRLTDTFLVGGENGLVYLVALHTRFDPLAPEIALAPEVLRYRYRHRASRFLGIENSIAVSRNLAFFADNGGILQAVDLRTFEPLWTFAAGDDTDASLTVSLEGGRPVLYTGNEVDHRGPARGLAVLRKLDGLTGRELWQRTLPCVGQVEPRHEPGLFATNVVGDGDIDDLVIFMVSRCPTFHGGTLLALDKATGRDVWRKPMRDLAWPSPTAFKDQGGKTWLLQADFGGFVHLIDARSGEIAFSLKLDGVIEASPAIFDSRAVIATRQQSIYGLEIR